MEAYRIENLSFSYPQTDKKALLNISISIESGEFITLCGKTGSGKSTLLKQLKSILTPYGKREGAIYFFGQPLEEVDEREQAFQIGYVFQSPDNQIVTDKVWHELAFGLESLGYDSNTIRLRVAEMASFFGIQNWFYKNVTELSGGQKQILNLASIMSLDPRVLILDEPTSQLDPIAASDFLNMLKKINRDLGITIIMTEHRLEEVIPISDRLVVLDEGKIIVEGSPSYVGKRLYEMNHPMFLAMTTAMQVHASVTNSSTYPITINEGRKWIDEIAIGKKVIITYPELQPRPNKKVIELKDVWFRYERNSPDVIKGLSLDIREGEFYSIVGGNGTGKTTALSLMNGINKPYRGKITISEKNTVTLPQNPQNLFVEKTVESDLYEMLSDMKLTQEEKGNRLDKIIEITEIEDLLSMHPYDLSGGEQQRVALAKVLLLEPKILLLDEPTKGLDNFFKDKLAKILKELTNKGVTIVMVSHDIEFCAKYSDYCALFFDGNIITSNTTREFFSGNSFYTTAANRMVRHLCKDAVTIEDVIALCKEGLRAGI